jgi:hypothetical protein
MEKNKVGSRLIAQTSLPITEKVLFKFNNLFWGDAKMIFIPKYHFLVSQNELSDVNKTNIDISNGQKFEHTSIQDEP